MKQYKMDGYLINEYPSGAIIKSLISDAQEPQEPQPAHKTLDERLGELTEQNLVLMDAIATLFETIIEGAV